VGLKLIKRIRNENYTSGPKEELYSWDQVEKLCSGYWRLVAVTEEYYYLEVTP
jgi:hypothetical protein